MGKHILRIAVNKKGAICDNYYDAVSDNTLQVSGSMDRDLQRAAWSIGESQGTAFEAGLNNLTQDHTRVLVHYGKERTQQRVLVRLEEPKDGMK